MSIRVKQDLSEITIQRSIQPQTISSNTTVNGSSIDLTTVASGKVRVVGIIGVGTRTDGTYAVKLQDSTDNSAFADLTTVVGDASNITAANTARRLTAAAYRRYVRAVITSTSVTTGAQVSADIVVAGRP